MFYRSGWLRCVLVIYGVLNSGVLCFTLDVVLLGECEYQVEHLTLGVILYYILYYYIYYITYIHIHIHILLYYILYYYYIIYYTLLPFSFIPYLPFLLLSLIFSSPNRPLPSYLLFIFLSNPLIQLLSFSTSSLIFLSQYSQDKPLPIHIHSIRVGVYYWILISPQSISLPTYSSSVLLPSSQYSSII